MFASLDGRYQPKNLRLFSRGDEHAGEKIARTGPGKYLPFIFLFIVFGIYKGIDGVSIARSVSPIRCRIGFEGYTCSTDCDVSLIVIVIRGKCMEGVP